MVIFHSYVSLPEGKAQQTHRFERNVHPTDELPQDQGEPAPEAHESAHRAGSGPGTGNGNEK